MASVDAFTRLARRAAAGDTAALAAFVEGGYDRVRRLCAGMVDDQSADDLAQEVFTRAVQAVPTFRGDSSARSWLLGVARHVCLDELRALSRRRRWHAAMGEDDLWPGVAEASAEVTVTDLVRRLEPERRAAFVLTQVLGLSYDEAARVCECPTGTVRSRVARARGDLLQALARVDGVPAGNRRRA